MKQVSTTRDSLVTRFPKLASISPQRLFLKYRTILLLASIFLFIGGCKKEDHLCKKTVPFKATYFVTSEVTSAGPPIQKQHLTAIGEGTPIGKATFEADVELDLSAPAPTPVSGKQIITTENGDKIFTTGKGFAIGPDANGDIKVVTNDIITGGTGKYEHATGSYNTLATASIKSNKGTDSSEGSITY